MLGLGLLAGVSVAVAATLDNDGLGPGAGPWGVGTPEEHGLSSKELDAASKLAADRVPDRYCILVVKDGLIMSESYFNNQTVDGRYGWFAPEQRSIHFFHFYYSLFFFIILFHIYVPPEVSPFPFPCFTQHDFRLLLTPIQHAPAQLFIGAGTSRTLLQRP